MKTQLTIALAVIGLSMSVNASASKYSDINQRTHIDNSSMNKISGARLRGMLVGSDRKKRSPGTGDQDCVTQIGNQGSNQSLIGNQQDIIIVGDVINFCQ